MLLTYGGSTRTTIQAILEDDEELGQHEGPGLFFIKVDGDDPAYRALLERHDYNFAEMLDEIRDPLDSEEARAAMEALVERRKQEVEAHGSGEDMTHPRKRGKHRGGPSGEAPADENGENGENENGRRRRHK
jgi:hypothetical protein